MVLILISERGQRQSQSTVTEQTWGFGCLPLQKANSRGRSWRERKEVFIWMLNILGEWGTSHLKAHLLHKTQTKPSHSQQIHNKR